jgi:hypothetical protein
MLLFNASASSCKRASAYLTPCPVIQLSLLLAYPPVLLERKAARIRREMVIRKRLHLAQCVCKQYSIEKMDGTGFLFHVPLDLGRVDIPQLAHHPRDCAQETVRYAVYRAHHSTSCTVRGIYISSFIQ